MNEKIDFNFCNHLAEGNIICRTTAVDRDEIIAKLAERLAFTTPGINEEEILKSVREREKLMPTVVAPGLAIPHARIANLDHLLIAIATSSTGIDFNTPELGPVNVVALVITPADDPGLHLQVLSGLAKVFCEPTALATISELQTPVSVINFFNDSKMEIPPYLMVKDLMNRNPIVLQEADTLSTAISTLASESQAEIPVLDDEGDLRGIVSTVDVLRFSLPEHILWMDDLSPILRFQPFAEMLKNSQDTKLADFMREEIHSIEEDSPAIQLVKEFIVEGVKQMIVTKDGRFSGIVDVDTVLRDLFWA